MAAAISYVSNLDGNVVARLPLDVERVVDGVRQLVARSKTPSEMGWPKSMMLGSVGKIVLQVRSLGLLGAGRSEVP